MAVLVGVMAKMGLNVRAVYALDIVTESDGRPSFPDLVYMHVRKASEALRTQVSRDIALIPVSRWRMSWEALCSVVLERTGRDVSSDIEWAKEKVAELGYAFSLRGEDSLAHWDDAAFSQTLGEVVHASSSASQISHGIRRGKVGDTSLQMDMGLSKSGLYKAFDEIGHDLSGKKSSTSRNVSATGMDLVQQLTPSDVDELGNEKIQQRAHDDDLQHHQAETHSENSESAQTKTSNSILPARKGDEMAIITDADVAFRACIVLFCLLFLLARITSLVF